MSRKVVVEAEEEPSFEKFRKRKPQERDIDGEDLPAIKRMKGQTAVPSLRNRFKKEIDRGYAAMRWGDNEVAEACFRQSITDMEGSAMGNMRLYAMTGLGHSLTNSGRYDEAITVYKGVIASEKTTEFLANAYVSIGTCYQMKGDFQNALSSYQTAESLGRMDDEVIFGQGNAFDHLGMLDQAVDCYGRINPINIQSQAMATTMTLAMMRHGDTEYALQYTEGFVSGPHPSPTMSAIHYTCLDAEGRKAFAQDIQRRYDQNRGGSELALVLGSIAYIEGDFETGERNGKSILGREPDNIEALMLTANSLRKNHNLQESLPFYDRALQVEGSPRGKILQLKSKALMGLHRFEEAGDALELAGQEEHSPSERSAFLETGSWYFRQLIEHNLGDRDANMERMRQYSEELARIKPSSWKLAANLDFLDML
jgi:tetratricopeptide (TPR) repeat protein